MVTIRAKIDSGFLRLCAATSAVVFLLTACNSMGGSAPAPTPKPTKTTPIVQDAGESADVDSGTPDKDTTASEKEAAPGGYLVSKDPDCKKADECPPANPVLTMPPALTGVGGTKLTWQFGASDGAQPKRRLAIIIRGLPELATIDVPLTTGNVVNQITVNYVPSTALTGQLDIIVRDFDRCVVSETENAVCISSTFNPTYDKQQPALPFTITANPRSVINCPKPGFFSTPPPGC